jgi:hypothetical protein
MRLRSATVPSQHQKIGVQETIEPPCVPSATTNYEALAESWQLIPAELDGDVIELSSLTYGGFPANVEKRDFERGRK